LALFLVVTLRFDAHDKILQDKASTNPKTASVVPIAPVVPIEFVCRVMTCRFLSRSVGQGAVVYQFDFSGSSESEWKCFRGRIGITMLLLENVCVTPDLKWDIKEGNSMLVRQREFLIPEIVPPAPRSSSP
jgi:hypothetical protein